MLLRKSAAGVAEDADDIACGAPHMAQNLSEAPTWFPQLVQNGIAVNQYGT
jgi:hypothetical protein